MGHNFFTRRTSQDLCQFLICWITSIQQLVFNFTYKYKVFQRQIIKQYIAMGKSHSTTVQYRTDPALLNLIQTLQQEIKEMKKKCETPEQFKEEKKKFERLYVQKVTKMKFKSPLTGQQLSKKNICFLAPTSVGKTTLANELFKTNGTVGLGSTTKEATVMKQTADCVYWDAPGINQDFGFYQPIHLGFFQSLNTAVILFDRDIDDVHLIVDLISKMGPEVIYARTKCDAWKPGMVSIEDQLKVDLAEIRKYDPKAKEVIPIGYGMYNGIKGVLKL